MKQGDMMMLDQNPKPRCPENGDHETRRYDNVKAKP
jgi:hypothetical protein